MNKFLSRMLSAVICAGVAVSTAVSASAETININPKYTIHGNKCGAVVITPDIERDVAVTITQISPDGDYKYYDTVLPSSAVAGNDYTFMLEGKHDDSYYKIKIAVPKYKGSNEKIEYIYDFSIDDPDYIDTNEAGYIYWFSVLGSEEISELTVTANQEPYIDENMIVITNSEVTFPISSIMPGDVNFDGVINLYDVIDIAKYMLNKNHFNDSQIAAGDYNSDGNVNLYDAIAISKDMLKK